MATRIRGTVIDSWRWNYLGICADIGCLKKPKEHPHEGLPVTGCTARRIHIRVKGRIDIQTDLSASVDMNDRDHHGEKEEGAIQIATKKTTNLHPAIEVKAVRRFMGHLRTEILFLKDCQWR